MYNYSISWHEFLGLIKFAVFCLPAPVGFCFLPNLGNFLLLLFRIFFQSFPFPLLSCSVLSPPSLCLYLSLIRIAYTSVTDKLALTFLLFLKNMQKQIPTHQNSYQENLLLQKDYCNKERNDRGEGAREVAFIDVVVYSFPCIYSLCFHQCFSCFLFLASHFVVVLPDFILCLFTKMLS